uniref:RNase H type-1 domain-containing protein n=1 Tax=viral metagenome TaxID=1070528 RepID=A0A6C0K304_9ZZZZ
MNFPFVRIRGRHTFFPPYYTRIQCSAKQSQIGTTTSVLLYSNYTHKVYSESHPIHKPLCPLEAEWAALFHGVQLARRRSDHCIALESDHPLILGLIVPGTQYQGSSNYFKRRLLDLMTPFDWVGARLITPAENYSRGHLT